MKLPVFAYRTLAIASGLYLCSVATEAAQVPVASTSQPAPASISADPGTWRRDPFIGSYKKDTAASVAKATMPKIATGQNQGFNEDIQLQGIMLADKAFHAMINGRTVKAGDHIGGVTISNINRYQVVVLNERKEKVIYDIYQGRIDRGKK